IFGMQPVETDTLYPKDKNYVTYQGKHYLLKDYATVLELNTSNSEGFYKDDFYANTPAITSHSYEKGKTYYIGARLDAEFHFDFYSRLIEDLSLQPAFSVKHGKGVSVQTRQDKEHDYVFIMNFTEERQTITLPSKGTDLLSGD